jgi:class 3 adenylate cyclase/tetratricopeptide (TPR) repeat protein
MAFCGRCGARLATPCPSCGYANPEGFAFCGKCGAGVAEAPAPARQGSPASISPQSYTPKHLAEKILTSKEALEGERKQVTVLFADLKGSMELLADRDPEEARKLLDPVLERMMEAVHHYEGTVNQVMGDGIMALFGAPIGHEDHAVRACYAALRMQRRVALYADELQRGGGTPVQIRVGLNSGEVVVRAIGSDLRMDYTAVGQTTHLAARMEQMARPGSVLVTGDTLRLAEGYVQVRPLGSIPVKGLEITTPVFEVTGTVAARSRFQASAARGLTRFVGRDRELQQLAQALERAAAGHGQAVAIVGEAGVGKSRLVWEFTRSHRAHGWLTLESGSVSYGKATPYLPVIDLLKAYCRIQERDDPRAIRERVAGKLLMLDRALEPLLTPLLALLDVPVEDAAWDALDPPQRRQRTLEAVKRLLLRESQVQPLLVVFEDLHWIDAETQALLDGLMESLPTARLLLLVNYRPEYQHAWGGKTYYLQVRIDPLPPDSAEELLRALLGEDPTLAPLTRMLIERTEGNPFFLEESVQSLVETRVLVGERGAYRLGRTPEALRIPATAQAILAARIDRLPPEEKRLLQAAAVIGKDVPLPLLQAIAEQPEDGLRQGLRHLQGTEFLYETSLFPDLEYTFKHALTHEVAYGSLLQERRRVLHARVVDAIEALYRERLPEQIERLAHHAFRGEAWEKAVAYLRQAGARAHGRSAYREAVEQFKQALDALEHLPGGRERTEQAIDIRLELRAALFPLGHADQILDCLTEAGRLVETLGDPLRLALVDSFMGNYCWWTGQPDRALAHQVRAVEASDRLGHDYRFGFRFGLGQAHHALGDYRGAIEPLTDAVEFYSEDRLRFRVTGVGGLASIFIRTWLAWCLGELGETAAAQARVEDVVAIAERLGHPFSIVYAQCERGRFQLSLGRADAAIPALERALDVGRQAGLAIWFPWVAAALGRAYALCGRTQEGLSLLEDGIRQAEATRFMFGQALRVAWLAEACASAGRMAEADEQASTALRLAREHKERGHEAWALFTMGAIAARREPARTGAAESSYRAASALASDLAMRPLVAHCHRGLGALHRRGGDRAKASEHLTTAATLYRDMGMASWLKETETAARELA